MSTGERSCKEYGDCGIYGMGGPCDTTCVNYAWNGKKPDTAPVRATIGNHGVFPCYLTRDGYKTLNGLLTLEQH